MNTPQPENSPTPPNKWENVDQFGDDFRLARGKKIIVVSGLTTAISLVLLFVGDATLRTFGGVGLALSLLALIPVIFSTRSARKRVREGRGLRPGDPYRAAGVSADDRKTR